MVERRSILATLAAMTVIGPSGKSARAASDTPREDGDRGGAPPPSGTIRQIAMVMYPEFFAQDLVGPYTVFASLPNTQVHLVARTREPILATPGRFPITPSCTFEECPRDLDLLLAPGGAFSTVKAIDDEATVEFVRDRAQRAKYVTSVCTGSLILGAAGMLNGYKATSHWVTHDLLSRFGATPVHARVVVDRNRITGGGVTAGIDFGLRVASILDGEQVAQLIQLSIEYDPEPPFKSGSPAHAPDGVRLQAERNYAPFRKAMESAVDRAARRLASGSANS